MYSLFPLCFSINRILHLLDILLLNLFVNLSSFFFLSSCFRNNAPVLQVACAFLVGAGTPGHLLFLIFTNAPELQVAWTCLLVFALMRRNSRLPVLVLRLTNAPELQVACASFVLLFRLTNAPELQVAWTSFLLLWNCVPVHQCSGATF